LLNDFFCDKAIIDKTLFDVIIIYLCLKFWLFNKFEFYPLHKM